MARSLSYMDAVRLLGGQDSRTVAVLEKAASVLMLGTAPAVSEVLGWFDAKADLVRLSQELVRGLAERKSGLSRYGRTERLEAAHTVIAVAAFFEAFDESELPARFGEFMPTRTEQLTLAGGGGVVDEGGLTWMMGALREIGDCRPSPQLPPEQFRARLLKRYADLRHAVEGFAGGLARWQALAAGDRELFTATLRDVPERACLRYEESFRRLAVDFPEVAFWANQHEHRTTRAALAGLEETLRAISSGRAPDERRQSLAAANRAELERRVAESGDVPDGIRMPALGEAYVPPRFRAADVPSAAKISEESWWAGLPARNDLQEFLIGHLTSPQALRAPLLVLGQPGSGKSVLTRVLAARLPAADFMPVRVVLRDAPAADDLQDQIEHAIRRATGERVEWPALARSAGDALPVILLDGFDELLQAVGVSQTDYLVKVARFQRREYEQGRPVAVVVTSRTAVADRARAPEQTVAARLEPFDEERVTAWLDIWNRVNAHNFASRGLSPLPAEIVLKHHVLAEQPLLLLMLALYDTNGNALQRAAADLSVHELYEQLLRMFAVREITKHQPGLSERDLHAAVEGELRRLSVVALAMFNRTALWITEAELGRDLAALPFAGPPRPPAPADLRKPLEAAELTLGRFFFIHRARASQDESQIQTYEFLHATFGEYFVARLVWQVLRDVAARQAASTMSFDTEPAEDDLLRALLSFQPLCVRAPVIDFLAAMASAGSPGERAGLRDVLLSLFRRVNHTPPGPRYSAYRPQSPGEPARYATYAANLLLLALCTSVIHGRELYPDLPNPVTGWQAQTMLWRSQLTSDGWTGLVDTVTLERIDTPGAKSRRDIALRLRGAHTELDIDPGWTFDITIESGDASIVFGDLHPDQVRLRSYFQCEVADDLVQHALEPLAESLGSTFNTLVGSSASGLRSVAHMLVALGVDPGPRVYRRLAAVANLDIPFWGPRDYERCLTALLLRLSTDDEAPAGLAVEVLQAVTTGEYARLRRLAPAVVRCAMAFLGDSAAHDRQLADVIDLALRSGSIDGLIEAELLVRLHDLDVPLPPSLQLPAAAERILVEITGRHSYLERRLRHFRHQ